MEELQGLVKDRLNALQDAQLKITVGKVEIVVRDQVRKVVRTILTFKDFIGAAISAEPHASLAWAGVLVVLPVSNILTNNFPNFTMFTPELATIKPDHTI
jgi:hypothetical protein